MNNKLVIMVSSTVYGIEELLDRIYTLLTMFGYEVWMSHKGTVPVFSNRTVFAHVLYLRGLMEKMGCGSVLTLRSCSDQGLPTPIWNSDEKRGVTLTFFTPEVTPEVRLLMSVTGEMTRREIQDAVGLKDDEHFRKSYLLPALEDGLIEMTIPDKPKSSKQKYRLTQKGKEIQAKRTSGKHP